MRSAALSEQRSAALLEQRLDRVRVKTNRQSSIVNQKYFLSALTECRQRRCIEGEQIRPATLSEQRTAALLEQRLDSVRVKTNRNS